MKTEFIAIVLAALVLYGCTQVNDAGQNAGATPTPQAPEVSGLMPVPGGSEQPAESNCVLMKSRQDGQVACFGCAGNVCKDPSADFEPYELPSDYIGIPYACSPTPNGCELAQ